MKRFFLLMLSLAAMASTIQAETPPPCPTQGAAPSEEKVIPVSFTSSQTRPLPPVPSSDPGHGFGSPFIDVECPPRRNVMIRLSGSFLDPAFLIDCDNNGLGVSYVEMENLSSGEKPGMCRPQAGTVIF